MKLSLGLKTLYANLQRNGIVSALRHAYKVDIVSGNIGVLMRRPRRKENRG
jgi:hypothetical protein